MGKVFEGFPSKVLPYRQDQCLKRKDFQLPTAEGRDHSRSMGTFPIIYFRLSSPWNGRLVSHAKFYHGLTQKAHEQLDATAGGSFMSLTLRKVGTLMEKIAYIKAGHHATSNHAI